LGSLGALRALRARAAGCAPYPLGSLSTLWTGAPRIPLGSRVALRALWASRIPLIPLGALHPLVAGDTLVALYALVADWPLWSLRTYRADRNGDRGKSHD